MAIEKRAAASRAAMTVAIRGAATQGSVAAPRETRAYLEPRFGRDFSEVPVHAPIVQQRSPGSTVQRKDDGKPAPAKEPARDAPQEKPAQKNTMTNCAKDYTVESWEADTCCLNRGFPDPGAKAKKADAECCNTFPKFVDDAAAALGFDGAASCRTRDFLNHRARVTPSDGSTSVDVLCVDTRRKRNAHFIELGFRAAQKAYGMSAVL